MILLIFCDLIRNTFITVADIIFTVFVILNYIAISVSMQSTITVIVIIIVFKFIFAISLILLID